MVDVEKIKAEIEALANLTAEEYCKEKVASIYAEFEQSRNEKINKLKSALEVFDEYQVEAEVEEEQVKQSIYDEFGNIVEE